MARMKITKSNIRKIVDWSSSRYCAYRKEEVINAAFRILQNGCGEETWTTGSYAERGHLGGWSWQADGTARTMTRDPGFNGESKSVFVFDAKN